MVNDPADDLIKWSDTGDSFFGMSYPTPLLSTLTTNSRMRGHSAVFAVLDQERFANEVLGRWFKHKNFSSFVRQLNMYGFHKIPHLQQGVLRSESETEFWNFEHPNFIRGQPDMLCLIQRKKQAQSANNSTDEAHVQGTTMRDGVGVGGTAVGLSQNQLLDINSIVNGIQAIKRHQETISADLNELKVSNQHLWQEAMLSRERHKKHQDIINRIVKFLGGLFGHTERIHRNGGGHTGSHAVVARKPQRLMIGDGKDGKKMGDVNEDGGCSARSPESTSACMELYMRGVADCFVLLGLFESMNTPSAVPSEPLMSPRFASVEPSVTDAPTPADTRPQPRPVQIDNNDNHEPSHPLNSFTTTTAAQESQQNHNDAMVQVALTQVLNSPSQMQKLLHALQSQSISPDMFTHQPQQQLIAPYDGTHYGSDNSSNTAMDVHTDHFRTPPYDFSTAVANAPPSPFSLSLLGGGGDDASDADQLIPFEKHDERLEKTYRTAAEINHDVNELQSSINSLIQTLGLDPGSLDVSGHHEHTDGVGDLNGNSTSAMNGSSISNGVGLGGEGDMDMFTNNGPDFDFDAFLMDMPRTTDEDEGDLERLAEQLDPAAAAAVAAVHDPQARLAGRSSEQLHAFLDDVASQDRGDVGPIAESSHIGFAPVSAPAPGAGAGSSHSFSSTLANGVGASPSSFTRPPTSSAGPVSGSTASRGRKRKSEVTDAGDDSPLPQTTITPSSSVATNKSKRKR